MLIEKLLNALVSAVQTVFGWLPDGPAWSAGISIPSWARIPVPGMLVASMNSGLGPAVAFLVSLKVWDVAYRMVRKAVTLVLGARNPL